MVVWQPPSARQPRALRFIFLRSFLLSCRSFLLPQPLSLGVRADCVTEASAAFAALYAVQAANAANNNANTANANTANAASATNATSDSAARDASDNKQVARNLLNYAHLHSGYAQPWAVGAGPKTGQDRPWAVTGDAWGIMSWTTHDDAYTRFYKVPNTVHAVHTQCTRSAHAVHTQCTHVHARARSCRTDRFLCPPAPLHP
jgi:hypothetical protein